MWNVDRNDQEGALGASVKLPYHLPGMTTVTSMTSSLQYYSITVPQQTKYFRNGSYNVYLSYSNPHTISMITSITIMQATTYMDGNDQKGVLGAAVKISY